MPAFAIIYSPGPAWLPDTPVSEQPLLEHGIYMHSLYQKQILLHGGPFTDNAGGMAIVKVPDLAAAEQIMQDDPAVINGIFTAQLHPWYMVNWDTFGQR